MSAAVPLRLSITHCQALLSGTVPLGHHVYYLCAISLANQDAAGITCYFGS